jgi:hypothetical protein
MAVLMTAEVEGQTQPGYDGMLAALSEQLKKAPGFILHTAHPTETGWRIIELWESKDAANQFFARSVAPNLPPGIRPKRTIQDLHSFVRP